MGVTALRENASDRPSSLTLGRPGRARYVWGVLALAGLYYGSAQVGYALDFAGPVAAILWLPAGVGIAFVYLGGLRYLPGVLVGDLLANDYSALPVGAALGQTCGNMLEMIAATLLMRRLIRRGSPLDSVGGLGGLLVAIAAGTAVSATVGPLVLLLGNVLEPGELPRVWRTWWLGDTAGALAVVPLALAWYRVRPRFWWRGRTVEAVILFASVAAISEITFSRDRPLTYLVFPVLIWAALRFGQRGATLAVAIVVGFTAWHTAHFAGPFAYQSISHSVLSTQLFIAVAALATLALAAVVSERERFAVWLTASRSRLVEAGDTERRRLQHNLHDGAQQRLTALVLRLQVGMEESRDRPERAPPLLEMTQTELLFAIEELRELARGIHPAVLTEHGLAAAIEGMAARSTVPIELVEPVAPRLDDRTEATAYYVVAEAITNAQRYAHAAGIRVTVRVVGETLHVEVVDDGIGGAVPSPGSGIEGLRDRVDAVGGRFEVDSRQGRGTRVAAAIPVA